MKLIQTRKMRVCDVTLVGPALWSSQVTLIRETSPSVIEMIALRAARAGFASMQM